MGHSALNYPSLNGLPCGGHPTDTDVKATTLKQLIQDILLISSLLPRFVLN